MELMACLLEDGEEWYFEMETNGTKSPGEALVAGMGQFNVSPKLGNSGMAAGLRVKRKALEALVRTEKAWFKFVVRGERDVAEVLGLVEQVGIPRARVILMPEGRTVAALDETAPWVAERCRDLGLRFSDRLHVRLWGDRRGV